MNQLVEKLQKSIKKNDLQKIKQLSKKIKSSCSAEDMLTACFYCLRDGSDLDLTAESLFKAGVDAKPVYAEKALSLVTELELRKKNPNLALKLIQIGLKKEPDSFGMNNEEGLIYKTLEQFDQAEAVYHAVLKKLGPRFEIMINLADLYQCMSRQHDAIAAAQLAIEINPGSYLGYYNLGTILYLSGQYKDSIQYFEKTLEIKPDHTEALLNLGQLLLKSGMFDQGWHYLESRWEQTEKINNFNIPLPLWKGEPLEGKRIIIWGDQGLGDHIMYARLFDRIIKAGGHLSIICTSRLEKLFRNSFPIDHYFGYVDEEGQVNVQGHFDYQISLGSLPTYFIHSFNDFGDGASYLLAEKELVEKYKQELHKQFPGKKLIGFTWRGGLSFTRKYARDTGLDIWRNLFDQIGAQFINLQYNATQDEVDFIAGLGGYTPDLDTKNDINGLAAYMKALDLVISADNTTVHLAGAVGVPVWNLLPFSSDWRWFFEEKKSYWYSSMRLFHQQELGDWKGCFRQVEAAFEDEINRF